VIGCVLALDASSAGAEKSEISISSLSNIPNWIRSVL
jgi:hypothetical protein